MVDYEKSTGSSGTMMIRVTATRVEFWLKAGSATFNHQLGWGYTVNGTTNNNMEFRFVSGGSWQMLKSWAVSTSQTVTFRLKDSGTSGLGGPTNYSVTVNRDTVPGTPPDVTIGTRTGTSVSVTINDPSDNGGDAINIRQLGRSPDGRIPPQVYSTVAKTSIMTGLTPGTGYYLRARVGNDVGWSNWGSPKGFFTLDEPGQPGAVRVINAGMTTLQVAFTDSGTTGGAAITDREVGWRLLTTTHEAQQKAEIIQNPTPTNTMKYNGGATIQGLIPGRAYGLYSRTRNSVGWSSWSPGTIGNTISGAFVKTGGLWKPAGPYVKVGGVWRIARPWGRHFGFWEESG